MRRVRRIGIVGYDSVQALDLAGPLDVFTTANDLCAGDAPYQVLVLGLRKRAFRTESGLRILPDALLADARALDTVVVPGGSGLRVEPRVRTAIALWLRGNARRVRRVATVCTGTFALAESGLADGRRVTTHWKFAAALAAHRPALRVDPDAIFIKDGPFYTSAGISAGIDLALTLVEEDLGSGLALAVARELVVYLKRSGGQLQYSEPLRVQSRAGEVFSDMVAWIHDNLAADLSIETLAERMHLSPRHFSRRFKAATGATPAQFVETARLDRSRWLLATGDPALEHLAVAVGYRSADAFRRAFERRFGLAPSDYRGRFASSRAAG